MAVGQAVRESRPARRVGHAADRLPPGWRAAKRAVDLAVGGAILLLALPVLLVLVIAIVIDSPGSPIYVQERLGRGARPFPMLKLRTMVRDAHLRRAEVEHLNEAKPPLFKIRNDPRVTRVGRFLRATSLDELPQILNVVAGHMSLVGPRPRLAVEFDLGVPDQRRRFDVKPGLAGIWQVSGRANVDFDRALELDLAYIDGWTFLSDLRLIWQTFWVVLRREGAC